jgi:hypothetical protein
MQHLRRHRGSEKGPSPSHRSDSSRNFEAVRREEFLFGFSKRCRQCSPQHHNTVEFYVDTGTLGKNLWFRRRSTRLFNRLPYLWTVSTLAARNPGTSYPGLRLKGFRTDVIEHSVALKTSMGRGAVITGSCPSVQRMCGGESCKTQS